MRGRAARLAEMLKMHNNWGGCARRAAAGVGCHRGRFPDVPRGIQRVCVCLEWRVEHGFGAGPGVSAAGPDVAGWHPADRPGGEPEAGRGVCGERGNGRRHGVCFGDRHGCEPRGGDDPGAQAAVLHRRGRGGRARVCGQQRIEHGERDRPGAEARDRRGGHRRAARDWRASRATCARWW